MQQIKIKAHKDTELTWYAVKAGWIELLGLKHLISSNSKVKGKTLYLSPTDYLRFIDVLNQRNIKIKFNTARHYDQSPVRRYDYYTPNFFNTTQN